jgi:MoaA/NifB/PqqE/SkfB family radical SAM enzyme
MTSQSKTFCALPFQHLVFGTEGAARMCCMASGFVTEHGAPMSLNVHTLEEIWNSAYMRSVRRAMLKGERISACEACYQSEAVSGHSYRTLVGLQAVEGRQVVPAEIQQSALRQRFYVDEQPYFLKLEVGNLCNLKCRMCYSGNSSQIERDPVHSSWSGGIDPLHAVWRGTTARIGPEPRIGVRVSGFHPQTVVDGAICRWTDGHGVMNVPLRSGSSLEKLELVFHPSGALDQQYTVIVNGRPLAKGCLQGADTPVCVDLSGLGRTSELTIELLSSRSMEGPGQKERGVPLGAVVLHRRLPVSSAEMSRPQLLAPRLASEGPWYMDDAKVFEGLLKPVERLRRLCITGGETLINKRVIEILGFLVDTGASKHIHLELPTNCTHVDDRTIERLRLFERVDLLLSLDGTEETYEYIRYPGRWKTVEANARRLKASGLSCVAVPVVQIYNVARLPDLYHYCDSLGMTVVENILHEPSRIAIRNLPPKTRKAIAAKLFQYCETLHDGEPNKKTRLAVAQYLDQVGTPADPDIVREMMLFTNDLDASRKQSFRAVHPELVELLADDGFPWIDETVHSRGSLRNRPARDREYAWL